MHISSGPLLHLSIWVAVIYCYCHLWTCRDKGSQAGRQRGIAGWKGPLERWDRTSTPDESAELRDVTSPLLGFSTSKRRGEGMSSSSHGAARLPSNAKLQQRLPQSRTCQRPKTIMTGQVHTHYMPLQHMSPLPFPVSRPRMSTLLPVFQPSGVT